MMNLCDDMDDSDSEFCVTADNDADMDFNEGRNVVESESDSPTVDDELDGDENMNQDEGRLVMPERKRKEPSPVWQCADRVPGGAKCKFCPQTFKCNLGSTSTILRHLVSKHKGKEEVKVMQAAMVKKKEVVKVKHLQKKKKSANQPSILNFSKSRGVMDPLKKRKMDEALVKMTIVMNKPFLDIENHFFRQVLFNAEPNYLCPSRTKLTELFDKMAVKVKEDLKDEILRDIKEAGHNTLSICTDHGTSQDRMRHKKNAITVARTTKDYIIKKDTLKLLVCEGSQTGAQIRKDVKQALIHGAGWREGIKINWTTDNESKQINARNPNKHQAVGLPTNHVGSCVDHTFELGCEESIQQSISMKQAVKKVRSLINYIKDCHPAKEAFYKIMEDAGVEPLAIIQGTSNRWFFKYAEVNRALLLKEHIDVFFDSFDVPETLDMIDEDDWELLLIYENALKDVVEAAKVLEGELYPTASSVIPFLDMIFMNLSKLIQTQTLSEDGKAFVESLHSNLSRRFTDGYKLLAPYNCLTLLDVRYADLYFTDVEQEKAIDDLNNDSVYDDVVGGLSDHEEQVNVVQVVLQQEQDSFSRRRAELLAAKSVVEPSQATQTQSVGSLKEKLKEEMKRFVKYRGSLGSKENPNNWWKNNNAEFPLLSKFWIAHSSFPATSAAAERVFNMDGLILTPTRYYIHFKYLN